ncbi:MmcQ/YjbR family DNA-binding protein [Shewanella gelidii]|uniref:MmcQ/YjbR family DNA-binding protein n=1 Tax=Shewanella gelidii TaxID=1642821 RepID=A0A917NAC7_9GAMM|nr:MmcQ/YjbR family DNA-binding protein [Shewanella gelidii]MCL1098496.1 MmcQ/YjbR family DNA-binding protein [Shewanella gelidii]GGI82311.1 hypothetical protein GCM10009332_19400 [Shewanella gelidii]
MDLENLKQYMLAKPATRLDFPFGADVSVFKVKGKMFALLGARHGEDFINLKCDPEEAVALRDVFSNVTAGYHMDKKHWISVYFREDASATPQGEIERLIDNSFLLVVSKMTKKDQQSILLHI